jgi:hypothetical protein
MRALFIALAVAATAATPAFAHPEPDFDTQPRRPPITDLAKQAVIKLVSQAKLPATWSNATVAKLDLRMKNGVDQWVVTFSNPAIRNPAQRVLYVLMTREGEFISANYRLI